MTDAYPRVKPVGDRAVTVELGATLDAETVGRVRALDERLRNREVDGVLETVPTYASLLVLYDRHRLGYGSLRERLLQLTQDLEPGDVGGRLVEVPAAYDGEDLHDVARAAELTIDDVIAIHSGQDYRALMLGFSPGFAYMGFLDRRLRLPRRKTPRTRVPPGSIGITGPQTGVYPRALPGGWNLIGRTSLRLFDPHASQPSTFMPGDRVRFLPTASLEASSPLARTTYAGHGVQVMEAGILTTIQDEGRPGLRTIAVPLTGYADPGSAAIANECVGNPRGAPLFEICGPGLKLWFDRPTFAAISGARVDALLERPDLDSGRMSFPMNVAVRVRPSNVLTINGLHDGARAYVAIAGLTAPSLLGSASVDLGSALLRPIEAGDRLPVDDVDADRARRDPLPAASGGDQTRVRVILGPQADHFDEAEIETFLKTDWLVGLDSDRVGARLDGPRLTHVGPAEVVSDGMVPGCIQVPPDGRPIAMMSDCPTTGGYPKIACVVTKDLRTLAQAIPAKTRVRFVPLGMEDLDR